MGSKNKVQMGTGAADAVQIISRRMIKPPSDSEEAENIHLTPWDLRLITIDYIQKGILLPKPPAGGERFVNFLAVSFARTLAGSIPWLAGLSWSITPTRPSPSCCAAPGRVLSSSTP
jgi:hypothetical protein